MPNRKANHTSSHTTASVCLSGHVITMDVDDKTQPAHQRCQLCGEPTITQCRHCGTAIRGFHKEDDLVWVGAAQRAPDTCHQCGQAFPWGTPTEKQAEG